MKKLFTILICSVSFLFIQSTVFAQDSSQTGAVKQINRASEPGDKLYGKKIQKESISTQKFEKPDTVAVNKVTKTKNKCCRKCKRKHQ